PLLQWLPHYALASALAIAATYVVLFFTQRRTLRQPLSADIEIPQLTSPARLTAAGIAVTSVVLLAASAFGTPLGLPTFLAGAMTTLVVLWLSANDALATFKNVT